MNGEVITNETRLTRIQALVVEILNDLLRARIEATDDTVQTAIARIGAWCRRDRSYVFVKRGDLVFNTHEWCAAGIEPAIEHLQGLPWDEFGPITEPLEAGTPFHVPDISDLPPGSAARELLEMQQIRSILVVPMRLDGAVYGFVGFDGVEHDHAFLPGELYLLQSVADVVCTVLTRRDREQAVARVQRELASERAFLASILATAAMGVMVIDAEGVIRFVNDAGTAIAGAPREALVDQRHDSPEFAITREDGTPFAPGSYPFDLVIASGQAQPEVRFALPCEDGLRFCAIHAAPVVEAAGRVARVVYAMIEVTEQVAAEQARNEALDDARRANAAKSNFLAKMSHEMRTPLNGVLGIAEVLERQIADEDQRRMVGVLRESGSFLMGIINDLLDMTKIEADRLVIERVPFSVVDLAQRIEAVHTLRASEKQLSFAVRLQGDDRQPRLGDPQRLLQILHNLIGNAIKFTAQGAVVVEIDCRDSARLAIRVQDTGIGMNADALARAFDEFEQADASTTRRFGGTGLGLPIVRRLVALMDGTMRLDSQPERGTVVQVDLPIALAPPAQWTVAPDNESAALPDMSALRVLAADDNRTNRMILGAMLGQLGVGAVMVDDGHSAIRAFDEQPFDVVILDISMPDIDGVTVMHELRRKAAERGGAAGSRPAFLAFTANAMTHQVEAYLQAGFDACMTKPLQLGRLAEALTTASGAARSPDSPGQPLRAAPARRQREPRAIAQ